MTDTINHPPHYTAHPSGIECIQVTEHMSFNVGNAVKYLWRADLKGDPIEDLHKARWYIDREIHRRTDQDEEPAPEPPPSGPPTHIATPMREYPQPTGHLGFH